MSSIEAKFASIGLEHFSPSQLNLPIANWLFDYLYLSKEERREKKVGENAAYGTSVHNAVQAILCHGQSKDDAVQSALLDFDFHPADESPEKREKFRELISPAVESGVELLYDLFLNARDEERISITLDGVAIPVIGYVDIIGDEYFCECKTKAPRLGPIKKDGTRSWVRPSMPKQPEWNHLQQVAVYWKATGLTPTLAYISASGSHMFTPDNCDQLKEESLEFALNELRQKALIRQNLISVSTDPKVLAGLMDPDFKHPFYWNHQFKDKAKELFKQ